MLHPPISVAFATNRQRITGPEMFGEGLNDPANPGAHFTGRVTLHKLSSAPDTGWVPDPNSLQVDPGPSAAAALAEDETGLVAFARQQMEAERAARMAAPAAAARSGVILLHGFASTFIDAVSRAAQVAEQYRANDIFCFSWPTRGKVSLGDYRADQETARRSAAAVARALQRLLAFLDGIPEDQRPKLNLAAHSMGCFALRHAIQEIRARHPELLKRCFEHALLVAADEDWDTLSDENKLRPLLILSPRIACYHAAGDVALAISAVVNGIARLGQSRPKDLGSLPMDVTAIDCSDVASTQGDNGESHYRHQYYRLSARVVLDVRQVVAGLPPHAIRGRLPDPVDAAGGRAWWIPFDENAGLQALLT